MGVIEESRSDWASPIVLVPKTDGSGPILRGLSQGECGVEVRRLSNAAVDELLDRLGTASFLFDAGLNERDIGRSPYHLYPKKSQPSRRRLDCTNLSRFRLGCSGRPLPSAPHGQNPPTAHRIRRCLPGWHHHLQSGLAAAHGAPAGGAESAEGSGLTANPKKCAIGRVEVRYLGFHLGHGQVHPQIDKTAAIAACPRPKTKKEVRQFLGLAGVLQEVYSWLFGAHQPADWPH